MKNIKTLEIKIFEDGEKLLVSIDDVTQEFMYKTHY